VTKNNKAFSITKSALLLAVMSFASRFLGMVRDRIFASHFGAGDILDSYFAAFRIPDLIFNLLVLGALSAAFIPIFTDLISHKRIKEAFKVANSILNIIIFVLLVSSFVLFIFMPFFIKLITPGFSLEKRELTVDLARIMLLSPILFGISNVAGAILNSFKKFLAYSIAPIFYNLGIIFGVLVFVPTFGNLGLALGVVLGAFLHMVVQLIATVHLGFRYSFIFDIKNKKVRKIGRLMIPRSLGLAVHQINLTISTIIGSTLSGGAVSVYNFANNLQSIPLGLFGISFAIASFPVLSETFSLKRTKEFVNTFSKTFRQILFLVVPISVLMLILRAQIVRIILGAGHFDWQDTRRTASALGFFTLSLFAQSLVPLLARSFYAMQDTKTPVKISVVSVFCNIFLALYLSRVLGVGGLALAFSISSFVNMFLLLAILRTRVGNLNDATIINSAVRIMLASTLSGIFAYGSLYAIAPKVDMTTGIGILIQALGAGLVFAFSYITLAFALRCGEVAFLNRFIRRFVKIGDFKNGN